MNRRKFITTVTKLAAISAITPLQVHAQDSQQQSTDNLVDILQPTLSASGIPALAAGIMKNGKVLGCGALGVRRIGYPTKVTPHDQFCIGSCTKAITATLAATFVEEGKLHWETTLEEAFPMLASTMHEDCKKVTIEMLLQCRHGLDYHKNMYEFQKVRQPITAMRLAFAENIVTAAPKAPPGTKFNYTGVGFILVGAALEVLSKTSWENLMRERIFQPLKMTSAGFGTPTPWNSLLQPLGHILENGRFVLGHGALPIVQGPAGTVFCTIEDYLKFGDAHASLGKRGPAILKSTTFEKLHTPAAKQDYAMGWFVRNAGWAKGRYLAHNGLTYNQGNSYDVSVAPNAGIITAVAANAWTTDGRVWGALGKLRDQMLRRFA